MYRLVILLLINLHAYADLTIPNGSLLPWKEVDGIKEYLESLKDFVRQAILEYIDNKKLFEESTLDKLCL